MKNSITESLIWACASLMVMLVVILGLMHSNLNYVRPQDVVRPLAVLLPLAFLATLLLMAVCRPLGRIFPVAIFLYFSFYDIRGFVRDFGAADLLSYTAILLCLVAVYFLLRLVDGRRASIYTLVAAGAMVAVTLVTMAPSVFYQPPPVIDPDFEKESLAAVTAFRGDASNLPDIIYIVPDRYASAATLRNQFGFDNAAFYAELRKRGFAVFEDSRSNYPKTFESMASTLNSGYLQNFTKTYGANTSDKRPIYETMENSIVQDRLRRLGYQFFNFGNRWEPTRVNKWADVNYQGNPPGSIQNLSEFERALLDKSPTMKIARLFTDAEYQWECKRIKRKFRRLAQVGNQAKPVFVMAHTLVPHQPIVFDASGHCLDRPLIYPSESGVDWGKFKAAYIEYLKYFNATILEVIDEQLQRRGPTGRKLLFVIQSDEGPIPKSVHDAESHFDLSHMSIRETRMKTGTINALLLPGGRTRDIPKLITPVNNWRVILNTLTGSEMKLLPDRVFIYPTDKSIFDFCEVTNAVTERRAARISCEK